MDITMNELAKILFRYGKRTTDVEFEEKVSNEKFYNRVSTYSYNGEVYYLHMVNGEVIECFKLR